MDGAATPVLALRAAPPNLVLRGAVPDQADSGRHTSYASSVASVNSAIPRGLCSSATSQHNALFEVDALSARERMGNKTPGQSEVDVHVMKGPG